MISIKTLSQQAEFAMPTFDGGLVAAAARALPVMVIGDVVSADAADRKRSSVDATTVCGYRHITNVAVLKGAFPGAYAWSPPI